MDSIVSFVKFSWIHKSNNEELNQSNDRRDECPYEEDIQNSFPVSEVESVYPEPSEEKAKPEGSPFGFSEAVFVYYLFSVLCVGSHKIKKKIKIIYRRCQGLFFSGEHAL